MSSVSPKINLTDVKFNHRTCTGRIKVRNNKPSTDSHSGTLHANKDKKDANDTSAFVAQSVHCRVTEMISRVTPETSNNAYLATSKAPPLTW